MICEKCKNDYPSTFYFATPTICKKCFEQLPIEEQNALSNLRNNFTSLQTIELRQGFGKRFLSALIDVLIVLAIVLAIYKFNGFLESYFDLFSLYREYPEEINTLQTQFIEQNKFNFLIPSFITLVYYLLEIFFAASLGKMALNLKIARTDAKPADSKTLWIRYLVKNSTSIISILWIITGLTLLNTINTLLGLVLIFGFLLILSRNKQNIQDIIAKTAVYRVQDLDEISKYEGDNLTR